MSWKKKLGIVIPVCCMAVTVVLCVLLYSSTSRTAAASGEDEKISRFLAWAA